MSCHEMKGGNIDLEDKKRILLMGNPNVGKSVFFSKMTGVNVISSNYIGTTVDYTIGELEYKGEKAVMIDVPGTYSLEATSEAEEVAVNLLNEGADLIICVLDATHLERNLDLALNLKEYDIPIVYCLNLIDIAEREGINIDIDMLEMLLGERVIPTIAVKDKGLDELFEESFKHMGRKRSGVVHIDADERWKRAEEIAREVQTNTEIKEKFIHKLERWTLKPWPGIPIAFLVLAIAIGVVVGGGKGLRAAILLPLIKNVIHPFLFSAVSSVIPPGIARNILVGEFGILNIGIEWPFALILPYVLLFYVVFSFLEDCGYLPRLGVLVDGILSKLGLQGGNIITIMMAYGCAVPAILGTRAAVTEKERIMVASLICFGVPCASQSAAFVSLLGDQSIIALIMIFVISLITMFGVGIILNKTIKGKYQPMMLEVPNLLMPDRKAYFKKLKMRMKHFLLDAEGAMFLGILIAALVAETGVLNSVSSALEPVVTGWLGLPKEASLALILGIIRRELAVLPLLDLNLNTLQLLVGSVVALFYLPCLSVFGVLAKEFSAKKAVIIAIATTVSAFIFAGLLNKVVLFFSNVI
ncbi:MAG: ferrous iron transporter B [Andreesenia angusta]|nr:ferrous iron transporter B [Andreesenia angusta]